MKCLSPVGSNTLVTKSTGEVAQKAVLSPFGERLSISGPGPDTPHGFTDQYHDIESGLDYFNARYYDSFVGRFLSFDPESFVGGVTFGRSAADTQQADPYAYVRNSPTVHTDPTGRCLNGMDWCESSTASTIVPTMRMEKPSKPKSLGGMMLIQASPGQESASEVTGVEGGGSSSGGASETAATDHKLHLIASEHLPAGHTAVAGESPDGTIVARSFYPNESAGVGDILKGDVPGVVKDDRPLFDQAVAGERGVSMHTFNVTGTQHDTALRTINSFASGNSYNLYRSSCVHAAAASLRAAGVVALNTGGVFAPTPAAIGLGIRSGVLP